MFILLNVMPLGLKGRRPMSNMIPPARKYLAVLAALLCIAPAAASSDDTSVRIVTSFYPIYLLTSHLLAGVESAGLENLTGPETGCLHDYRLTARDMKTLSQADLFIANGAGMESFLTDIAAQIPGVTLVTATEGMPTEGHNAHVWLTPSGAAEMSRTIAAALKEALPGQGAVIDDNLSRFVLRMDALQEDLSRGLEPVRGRTVILFHEAFECFAESFGLHVAAVVEHEPDAAVTPAQLKDLADLIAASDYPPLFIEPAYPDLAAQILSRETGVRVYALDPLVSGPAGEEAADYYEQVMLMNMRTLLDALDSG
jgi:zinc transport system substrate-binding protein